MFRAEYKTHPPLSADSLMGYITAFRTFILKVFSFHCHYSLWSEIMIR